ncbi:MAG: metal ABC transporter permease [Pseudomonadota bacterium]
MDIDTLLLPFQFAFMQNAFLMACIVSVPTAVLSCFLVVKGWALMGDAVSHAVLPGIVIAHIINIPLLVGAFVAGMICALATGFISENSRVKSDTVMGVVFAGMFALGIVLFVAVETDIHLDHILFGNMLGVDRQEIWSTGLLSLVVSLALFLAFKDLILQSFDPAHARVSGLPVRLLHYGLLALLSLTVVATLNAVGLILAIGLLIAPGAIAYLLTRRFSQMVWFSVLICISAMLFGTYASFFLDSAPAPTIILTLTLVFILVFSAKAVARLWTHRRTPSDV